MILYTFSYWCLVNFILPELGHVCHSSKWLPRPWTDGGDSLTFTLITLHSPSDLWIPVGVNHCVNWAETAGNERTALWEADKGYWKPFLIKIRSFHFHLDGLFHRSLKQSILLSLHRCLWPQRAFFFRCTNMDVFTLQWGLPFWTVTFTCIEISQCVIECWVIHHHFTEINLHSHIYERWSVFGHHSHNAFLYSKPDSEYGLIS